MPMPNEKEIAQKIYAILCDKIGEIKKIEKWNTEAFLGVFQLTLQTVKEVEAWMPEFKPLTSEQKKKVAVEVLNKFIDIPFVPDWLEDNFIAIGVDKVVDLLNKLFGHDWFKKTLDNQPLNPS